MVYLPLSPWRSTPPKQYNSSPILEPTGSYFKPEFRELLVFLYSSDSSASLTSYAFDRQQLLQ